jgi:hypothetical protein
VTAPHDNTHLIWRIQRAGAHGLVLQGRTAIAQSSIVDLYFPDEEALNDWLTFTVPSALTACRREQAGPDEAAKSAIRRAAGTLDQTATPSEVANAVVEALKASGLSLVTTEAAAVAPEAPAPPVVVKDTSDIVDSRERRCPETKQHRPHKWHNSVTTTDHDCPGLFDGFMLRTGALGLGMRLCNSEADLEKGRWTDPGGAVWHMTIKGEGPPLEDKLGDLWHWAGGYTYAADGWPWPLLDRDDWSVQDLSMQVVQQSVGPLHYTDEVLDG